MGFRVDLNELHTALDTYKTHAQKTQNSLRETKKTLNQIITTNAFTGTTGQTITNSINNIHMPILVGLDHAYTILTTEYTQLLEDFKNHVGEHDDHAIFNEEALEYLKQELAHYDHNKTELDHALKTQYTTINDILALSPPHDNYEPPRRQAGKTLNDTAQKIRQWDNTPSQDHTKALIEALTTKIETLETCQHLDYDNPTLTALAAETTLTNIILEIDQHISHAQQLAIEEAEKTKQRWEAEHPLEMFLHTVTDMIGGLWGAAVDYTKTLTWLGPVRDLLLAAEGLIGAAGAIITGLALGTVTLGRLTASGLTTASYRALGLQEPAWARSELAQANTTIGQGWKRVQAWSTVTGIITGNGGSIPETTKTEVLETFTGDIDTIGSYAEGIKDWDAYDWGKLTGEIGVIFLPGGAILKTTRTVSKSVPLAARIATDTTRVAGHVDVKAVEQTVKKTTTERINGNLNKLPMTVNSGIGNPVKIAGKGNTGRTAPASLEEQIAMHEVKSYPLKSAKELPITMNDSRWPAEEGWVKMQRGTKLSDGKIILIHFLYNKNTGIFDDFKFK